MNLLVALDALKDFFIIITYEREIEMEKEGRRETEKEGGIEGEREDVCVCTMACVCRPGGSLVEWVPSTHFPMTSET